MLKFLRLTAASALYALVATDAATAGVVLTPGPAIGAGAPALAVFAAGYYLIRRRKRR